MAVDGYYDPLQYGSDIWIPEVESAESSSTSGDGHQRHVSFSNEEVTLLSTNPKKRAEKKRFRESRHPVPACRGVRRKSPNKWVSEVREPCKQSRIWLGTFPTAKMAARAHDVAALALRGRSACLNVTDSSWRLPSPESTDAKKAASEAAEAFRPRSSGGDTGGHPVEETQASVSENVVYMDEEAVFGMPGLFANMAEGLMLPPPPPDGYGGDDDEFGGEVWLWSY